MGQVKINKVRSLRGALGKSQKEISEIIGISQAMYGRKERKTTDFSDKEKIILLEYFKKYFPNETIETLFFK